jgi:hypothetical protein
MAFFVSSASALFDAMFPQQGGPLEFVTRSLPIIPGIVRWETWHLLRVMKRNYDWLNVRESG